MKFSIDPSILSAALAKLDTSPRRKRRERFELWLEATPDGLLLEIGKAQERLRAQVAIAGACVVDSTVMQLAIALCPSGAPLTFWLRDGHLQAGPMELRVNLHLNSHENGYLRTPMP